MIANEPATIGVLLSGGLDSAILAAHLVDEGRSVRPFYVRSRLVWETCELASVRRYLAAIAHPRLAELVLLDLPLADLYEDHWSVTGCDVPGADTPDAAVYLPGRNALLLIKTTLWCQLNAVEELALASLGTSPFADATPEFFADFQALFANSGAAPIAIRQPFAGMNKSDVMRLGKKYPLQLTFSCIAPRGDMHCGQCNKCAERMAAFESVGMPDSTKYFARGPSSQRTPRR
jgi:7-cyano-7-deazaguanine synthase